MRVRAPVSSGTVFGLVARGTAAAVLAGALAYLVSKVLEGTEPMDFRYIYLAGQLWLDGANPYSDLYKQTGEILHDGKTPLGYMLYPPHWWGIATAAALLPFEIAGPVWRILSAVFLIGGCLVLHGVVRQVAGPVRPWRTWLMVVLAATMSATAITLSLGQTSCLLFLGICLYARAFVARDRLLMGLALVIVMLKPQFGLAMSLFLVSSPFWWRSLAGAAVAVLGLSLPAILPFGPGEVVRGYLHALGQWELMPPNTARNTTGLRYLAWMGLGVTIPGKWPALAATALALGLGVLLGRWRDLAGSARDRAAAAGLLIAMLALAAPLHIYDMMLLIPLVALGAALPAWAQGVLVALMAVSFRPNNLEQVLGLVNPGEIYFIGTGTATIAILLMTVLFVVAPRLAAASFRPARTGRA